jgi:curved DNA-binding protein CbpA
MDTTPDYYQSLGLVPHAEPAVVEAAYKVLMNAYRPDKNPSPEVAAKIKEINSAYDVLSDSAKKMEYDESRKAGHIGASDLDFRGKQPFQDDALEKDWEVKANFTPAIKTPYVDMERISWRLAFTFKLHVLRVNEAEDPDALAARMKKDYLSFYFGRNEEIIKYAELMIKAKEINAAQYLNRLIDAMGDNVSEESVHKKINKRIPTLEHKIKRQRLYEECCGHIESSAKKLVELHGGKVSSSFLGTVFRIGNKIALNLDGKTRKFKDSIAFCMFVSKRFAPKYL